MEIWRKKNHIWKKKSKFGKMEIAKNENRDKWNLGEKQIVKIKHKEK